MTWALFFTIVVVVAIGFDFTNGFHDAANAIATSVGTRALTPAVALGLAAVFNLIGAFIGYWTGSGVSKTIQSVTTPGSGYAGMVLIAAALAGAILWNLCTWRLGLPSSSTHALIGGVVGAALTPNADRRMLFLGYGRVPSWEASRTDDPQLSWAGAAARRPMAAAPACSTGYRYWRPGHWRIGSNEPCPT